MNRESPWNFEAKLFFKSLQTLMIVIQYERREIGAALQGGLHRDGRGAGLNHQHMAADGQLAHVLCLAQLGNIVDRVLDAVRLFGSGVERIDALQPHGEEHRIKILAQALERDGFAQRLAMLDGNPADPQNEVNLGLGEYLRPAFGVYAVRVSGDGADDAFGGRIIDGVANIGMRPTVGTPEPRLEANLFDVDADLYGRHLRVSLVDFIRPEKKFSGLDALKAQIAEDAAGARALLAEVPHT